MSDAVFWAEENDDGELLHGSIEDAIEDFLDAISIDEIPDQATFVGYSRMVVDPYRCDRSLDDLLEYLDEEYGNPDKRTTPTPEMREAEREFVAKVLSQYAVWQCEPNGEKETIECLRWISDNRPDWLGVKE